MVKRAGREVRIYMEGGGDQSDGRAKLRIGMQSFLRALREQDHRVRWNVIPSGGRKQTYDDFCEALRVHKAAHCVLLVDSEEDSAVSAAPWAHLAARQQDRWAQVGEPEQCHLMIATMESWFLADPDALEHYYGKDFHRAALPRHDKVEEIPKQAVAEALKRATQRTKKGEYHKIRHGAELLGLINPDRVCQRAPGCVRLFHCLQRYLEEP